MSIDYAAVTRCYRKNKSAVTRATNKGDHAAVIRACETAFEDFDRYGWPDNWAHFQRAKDDAEYAQQRAEWSA